MLPLTGIVCVCVGVMVVLACAAEGREDGSGGAFKVEVCDGSPQCTARSGGAARLVEGKPSLPAEGVVIVATSMGNGITRPPQVGNGVGLVYGDGQAGSEMVVATVEAKPVELWKKYYHGTGVVGDALLTPDNEVVFVYGQTKTCVAIVSTEGHISWLHNETDAFVVKNMLMEADGSHIWVMNYAHTDKTFTVLRVPTKGAYPVETQRFPVPAFGNAFFPYTSLQFTVDGVPFLLALMEDNVAAVVSFDVDTKKAVTTPLPFIPRWDTSLKFQAVSVAKDVMIVLWNNNITAINLSTGEHKWNSTCQLPCQVFWGAMLTGPNNDVLVYSRRTKSTGKDGNVDVELVGRDALSGTELWSHFVFTSDYYETFARVLTQPGASEFIQSAGRPYRRSVHTGAVVERAVDLVGRSCKPLGYGSTSWIGNDAVLINCYVDLSNGGLNYTAEPVVWGPAE